MQLFGCDELKMNITIIESSAPFFISDLELFRTINSFRDDFSLNSDARIKNACYIHPLKSGCEKMNMLPLHIKSCFVPLGLFKVHSPQDVYFISLRMTPHTSHEPHFRLVKS